MIEALYDFRTIPSREALEALGGALDARNLLDLRHMSGCMSCETVVHFCLVPSYVCLHELLQNRLHRSWVPSYLLSVQACMLRGLSMNKPC